jgi:ATP/maltotriose-dependent transcriptional regulator MalT
MLKSWLLYHRIRMADMASMLDQLRPFLNAMPADSADTQRLHGEYAVLRSYQYFVATDVSHMQAQAWQALDLLPREALYARSMAIMLLSTTFQMHGEFTKATEIAYQTLRDETVQHTTHHTRLLTILGVLHWLEADLPEVRQIMTEHLNLSHKLHLPESLTYARYWLGVYHYERQELAQAEQFLTAVVNPAYPLIDRNSAAASFLLALTYLGLGKADEAEQVTDRLLGALLKQGNLLPLGFARALKAELTLRQGKLTEAASWLQHHQLPPLFPITRPYLPHLTAVKVFLVQIQAAKEPFSKDFVDDARAKFDNFHLQMGGDHALYYLMNLAEFMPRAMSMPAKEFKSLERTAQQGGRLHRHQDGQ